MHIVNLNNSDFRGEMIFASKVWECLICVKKRCRASGNVHEKMCNRGATKTEINNRQLWLVPRVLLTISHSLSAERFFWSGINLWEA